MFDAATLYATREDLQHRLDAFLIDDEDALDQPEMRFRPMSKRSITRFRHGTILLAFAVLIMMVFTFMMPAQLNPWGFILIGLTVSIGFLLMLGAVPERIREAREIRQADRCDRSMRARMARNRTERQEIWKKIAACDRRIEAKWRQLMEGLVKGHVRLKLLRSLIKRSRNLRFAAPRAV